MLKNYYHIIYYVFLNLKYYFRKINLYNYLGCEEENIIYCRLYEPNFANASDC